MRRVDLRTHLLPLLAGFFIGGPLTFAGLWLWLALISEV